MRRLKMITKGPNGNYRRGQVIEVDDIRASILLSGKHAKDAEEPEEVIIDGDPVDSEELQTIPRQV